MRSGDLPDATGGAVAIPANEDEDAVDTAVADRIDESLCVVRPGASARGIEDRIWDVPEAASLTRVSAEDGDSQ